MSNRKREYVDFLAAEMGKDPQTIENRIASEKWRHENREEPTSMSEEWYRIFRSGVLGDGMEDLVRALSGSGVNP